MVQPVTTSPSVPTVQAMILRFPEFSTIDASLIQFAIDEAAIFMSQGSVSVGKLVAHMYLTAHILTMNKYAANNDGMDISAETIGRISIRYRDPQIPDPNSDLITTPYGRRYKQLREMGIKKFKVIGGYGSGSTVDNSPYSNNWWFWR